MWISRCLSPGHCSSSSFLFHACCIVPLVRDSCLRDIGCGISSHRKMSCLGCSRHLLLIHQVLPHQLCLICCLVDSRVCYVPSCSGFQVWTTRTNLVPLERSHWADHEFTGWHLRFWGVRPLDAAKVANLATRKSSARQMLIYISCWYFYCIL